MQASLNLIALKNRATRLAQTGQFRDSAQLHRQLREDDVEDFNKWRDEALAWIAAGDVAEYRHTTGEMLQKFHGNTEADCAAWVLYCCARRPDGVEDVKELNRFAKLCAGRYPLFAAFGMLRCGHYREAAELLVVSEEWQPLERDGLANLAMAYHHLGQQRRARDVLREAREMHKRIQGDDRVWHEACGTFINEAAELIGQTGDESIDDGIMPADSDGKPLNLDFETGTLADWTILGEAFKGQPVAVGASLAREDNLEIAPHGSYWIRTYGGTGLQAVGDIASAPFEVVQPWASFLLGGCNASTTRVEIVRQDTNDVIYRIEPVAPETMRRIILPMNAHLGKKIFIRLVNDNLGGHLHMSFDNFRFHATQPGRPTRLAHGVDPAIKMKWDVRFYSYENEDWSDASRWKVVLSKAPLVTRTANQIDYEWGPNGPSKEVTDHFATLAVSKSEVPAGDYLIATHSDDGVRVSIDDRRVIENWSPHAPSTDIATVHLTSGEHTFQIEHFDAEADASLRFRLIPLGSLGLGATAKATDR